MSFHNRIRLPFYLKQPQFPIEKDVFRKANGVRKTLSAIVSNTYLGTTDYLPEDWHRKLAIALSHDFVQVENERYLTEVVLDSEYSIEWPDFKNYPIAPAKFTIQVTPFNASNSNCQTCDQASQLSLEDDTFAEPLNEGDTAVFDDVTENDSICCYPFTISLVSYNHAYLDSAILSEAGELTIEIKDSVVTASNILVATYMVTCADGSYDEANVYADFVGTDEGCAPPSDLVFSDVTDTEATASWTAASPVPDNGYIWRLYDPGDPVTPLQTGDTTSTSVDLTGLTAGIDYIFEVYSQCDAYTVSEAIQDTFTTTGENTTCAEYSFYNTTPGIISYSYLNCGGVMTNGNLTAFGSVTFCALTNTGAETPFYFTTSAISSTLTYLGLC